MGFSPTHPQNADLKVGAGTKIARCADVPAFDSLIPLCDNLHLMLRD
jgi:hypothetical protein